MVLSMHLLVVHHLSQIKILDNAKELVAALIKLKPSSSKGLILKVLLFQAL